MSFLAALLLGCGSPSVDLPDGGDITSDQPVAAVIAPKVTDAPARYPYPRVALRGVAGKGAQRVFVEGAGNPAVGSVQPNDGVFCVDVDIAAAPAQYTLTLQSQAGDGTLSAKTLVKIDRDNDADPPKDAKLCNGTPAGN